MRGYVLPIVLGVSGLGLALLPRIFRPAAVPLAGAELPRGGKFRVRVKFQNTGELDWTFGVGFTFKDSAGIQWDCYTGGCDKGTVSGGPGGAKIDSHFASAGQIVEHTIDLIPVPTAVALGDAQVLSIVWKNPTVPPSEELATTGWLTGYLKITGVVKASIISIIVEKV